MATREEVLSEAYRRGIMPPDVKVAYEEAARRGLHGITLPGSHVTGADTTVPQPAPTFPTQPQPAPDMIIVPQERPQIGHPLPQGAWEQDLTAPMPRHLATQQLQQYLDQIDTELPYPDPNPPPPPLTIGLPGPQSAFAQPDLTAPPPLTTPSREIAYEHSRGGAEQSWIQPGEVGAAAFGAGAKIAYSAGAKLMPSFMRGVAAMIPAGVMEFPIGQAADLAAESGNPELALLISVGLGFGSGLTVETLAEKGLLKAVTGAIRAYPKVAKATLPKEVFAKLKGINVAVGERGALGAGPVPPRPVEAPKEPAPTFYSQLEEISEKKLPGKMFTRQAIDQIDAMVKKGEVKAEEVDTVGVRAWLEAQGDRKVTKAEVMDYLKQNRVELEETVKGGAGNKLPGNIDDYKIGLTKPLEADKISTMADKPGKADIPTVETPKAEGGIVYQQKSKTFVADDGSTYIGTDASDLLSSLTDSEFIKITGFSKKAFIQRGGSIYIIPATQREANSIHHISGEIALSDNLRGKKDDLRKMLIHELTHWGQVQRGDVPRSFYVSPEESIHKYMEYLSDPAEVKARFNAEGKSSQEYQEFMEQLDFARNSQAGELKPFDVGEVITRTQKHWRMPRAYIEKEIEAAKLGVDYKAISPRTLQQNITEIQNTLGGTSETAVAKSWDAEEGISAILHREPISENDVSNINHLLSAIQRKWTARRLGYGDRKLGPQEIENYNASVMSVEVLGKRDPKTNKRDHINPIFIENILRKHGISAMAVGPNEIEINLDKPTIEQMSKLGSTLLPLRSPKPPRPPTGGQLFSVIGAEAGFEEDEDGNLTFDPEKALVGMLAMAAGKKGAGKAKWLGARIVDKWDAKVAEPIIEFARRKVNGAIWHEDLRHWFGLNRSKKFGDLMRDYNRDFKQAWVRAREIAEEIAEIAPTKLEQQRFRQILKGSVTASSELTAKAQQLNKLFSDLKDELKAHDLLRYSQFDKATDLVGPMNRKERARIGRMLSGPDPETLNLNNLWWYAEKDLGLDPQKIIESRSEKRVLVEQKLKKELGYGVKLQREQDRQVLLGAVQRHLEFQRSRLKDYYQVGSAEEYFPLVYDKHEGLTPKGRQKIEDELKTLRRRSRFGNPEGRQDLEETIAQLEEMLKTGVAGRRAYRTSRKQLVKGYSHRRVDLPIAIQRQMGLIEEAAFPVGKAYGIQATDILKAKLFEEIAAEGSWAYKAQPGVEMPANYHLVEDEKFGALNGLHVRKDVWDDLREVEEWRSSFVRGWDYLNGVWKGWHTVWNPATHSRNTYWNVIAAWMGDVPITDLGKAAVGKGVYFKAGQALKQGKKNVHYQEAQKWGLLNNTFYSSELNKFRDELEAVRDGKNLKHWIRTVMSAPGKAYEGNEQFFKMAVFIKGREDGLSVDQAARKAEKVLFNYADIPPIVKHGKRWAIPFMTFAWKFWPMLGEMVIRRPHKVLALLAMGYGLEELGRKQLGYSDEEAEAERKLLPPWQRRRVFGVGHYLHVLMPFKDKWGDNLYWDLSTILPYAGAGEEAGQSGIPMADLMPVQNPLLSLAYGLVLNRESFTGKDIYDKTMNDAMSEISELANEALKQRLEKQLAYAWKQIGPPIAPGGYNWSKLKTGLANTLNKEAQVLDWADRPYELREAVLSGIFGIKLTPADEEKLKEFETYKIRAILKKFNEAGQKLRRQAEKNEITKDEYKAGMRQLADWERLIVKERAKNLKK